MVSLRGCVNGGQMIGRRIILSVLSLKTPASAHCLHLGISLSGFVPVATRSTPVCLSFVLNAILSGIAFIVERTIQSMSGYVLVAERREMKSGDVTSLTATHSIPLRLSSVPSAGRRGNL